MQAEVPVNQLTIPKLASNWYDICLRNRPSQHANCTVDLDEAEYLTIQYFCSAPLESTTGMIHYSIVPHTKSCCRFENFNSFLFCLLTFFAINLFYCKWVKCRPWPALYRRKLVKYDGSLLQSTSYKNQRYLHPAVGTTTYVTQRSTYFWTQS